MLLTSARSRILKVLAVLVLMAAAQAYAENPLGDWTGSLKTASGDLRLQISIKADPSGGYSGTLDSPDQGARGIPIASIVEAGGQLVLDVSAVGARYEGRWNEKKVQWEGKWTQGPTALSLDLVRGTAPKPARPQTPAKPYPYREEEVAYENPRSGLRLAGTLTVPSGAGPHPAALLISGSGQQDRDETVADHKPFWVMADHLTRRGIAVLRVDDRGAGGSAAGDLRRATSADFASDVTAGIAFLRQRPDINPGKVGLIGHSEGGMIAASVAAAGADVSWLVLLAAPGIPGEAVLLAQNRVFGQSMGFGAEQLDDLADLNKEMYAIIRAEPDAAVRRDRIRPLIATIIRDSGMPAGVAEAQLQTAASEWFRHFIMQDPANDLKKVRCPVLALNGAKDMQIASRENLEGIRRALSANPRVEVRELAGLNHLFQNAVSGAPSEYARLTETFAPQALQIISAWILDQVAKE